MLNRFGFSLIELMISLALGLLLIAALTTVFVQLLGSNSMSLRLSELNTELAGAMTLVAGDLRRAGYGMSHANEFEQPLIVAAHPDEPQQSCVLFAYDENGNGEFDGTPEQFGYRLKNGQLQRRRNGRLCEANGWEGVLPSNVVQVVGLEFAETRFELLRQRVLNISLTMALTNHPTITRNRMTQVVLPYD